MINKQFDNFTNILKLYNHSHLASRPLDSNRNPGSFQGNHYNISADIDNVTNTSSDEQSLPDMYEVLLRFGIDPSQFREVPLDEYRWDNFDHRGTHEKQMSPTISQRIKTMKRRAKIQSSYQRECEN